MSDAAAVTRHCRRLDFATLKPFGASGGFTAASDDAHERAYVSGVK
jgi:hypothetical protein